jgi:hypothetical protein
MTGVQVATFKRDARIHDKHSRIPIFEFGKAAGAGVETHP